jgi:aminoglycoside phosphotransferase (APT) family kinase protein
MAVPTTSTLMDEEALRAFLQSRVPEFAVTDAFSVDRLHAGHSNVTFGIAAGERRYVLRRPPAGPLAPSAHDVLREFRILERLVGAGLRAPRPVVACDDPAVIGAPFFVMERVDGIVLRKEAPPELGGDAARRALSEDIVETLVEIHAADWHGIGLDEVVAGSADYLSRQANRWQRMLEHSRTRELPGLDGVTRWLVERMPESQATTIVHGDFKLDNLIVRPGDPPRCAAVLDWELSTIGDPLADLAWLMVWWAEPGEAFEEPLTLCEATGKGGFLGREELRELYERRTGRDTSQIAWYEVFCLWRLAILFEGSYKRHVEGTADDDWFAALERGVPYLIDRARRLIEG